MNVIAGKRLKLWSGSGKTEIFLAAVLLVLFVVFGTLSPVFLTTFNLMNLLRQTAIVGVVTIGMVFVIISSGIDLSVGSVVGFSGVITATALVAGVPIPLAILAAVSLSALVGLVNGVLIYDGKVPPFIATLGTMAVLRAVIMLITGAQMISGLPREFLVIAQASLFGIPILAVVWIALTVVAFLVIRTTVFGRSIFAYGSNKEAARLSGINVRHTLYGVYMYSAVMCAIAGVLLTARLSSATPTAGSGFELDAIAAAVVGGASLSGGEGSILGAFLGALMMSTLRQGGTLIGLNSFIMEIIIGSLIVVAVLLDQVRKRRGGQTR
ncbi:MAG: ABC transporter permease [Defluviitaleaceae bacterium]|nr:ABC transporter permease [Defluviitaleaceae bacterium]